MKSIVNYILLFIVISSCTKFGKNITIEGRVLNPITGEGIEGVKMSLVKTTNGLPSGEKTIGSAVTSSDGYYKIEEKSMKAVYLQINTFGNYHPIGWYKDATYSGGNNFPIAKGAIQTVDFHAVPYGTIKLNISNVNCQGINDSMQFRSKYQFDSDFSYYSTYRLGCYSYLSPTGSKVPLGYHYYETKVTRNGITTYVYDTVFVPANNEATIVIDY